MKLTFYKEKYCFGYIYLYMKIKAGPINDKKIPSEEKLIKNH